MPQERPEPLALRISELSKFLTPIACLLPPALTWNVQSLSSSFEWVFKYLGDFYGIRRQGARFMKIDEISYNGTDSPQQFYVEIHQAFADSLRKSGERVLFWDNKRLDRDEIMSPTLENTVVLWWLKALDPRLHKRVGEVFEHLMKNNVTLRDIQPKIAERVTDLLQELDASRASVRAIQPLSPELNAVQQFNAQPQAASAPRPARTGWPKSFCRLCFVAGAQPATYTSHKLAACPRLSNRDTEELQASFNSILAVDDVSPTPVPGWDDEPDLLS